MNGGGVAPYGGVAPPSYGSAGDPYAPVGGANAYGAAPYGGAYGGSYGPTGAGDGMAGGGSYGAAAAPISGSPASDYSGGYANPGGYGNPSGYPGGYPAGYAGGYAGGYPGGPPGSYQAGYGQASQGGSSAKDSVDAVGKTQGKCTCTY